MSNISSVSILNHINSLEEIQKRYQGLENALNDESQGKHATLMHLMKIGQNISKMELAKDFKNLKDLTKIILYNYENVDLEKALNILETEILPLKSQLKSEIQ